MRPVMVTVGPFAAASANAIAQSQTLGAAGPLTLNGASVSGGVATLDVPRRVAITSAGNDSGITWTVTGTTRDGPASEIIQGANAGTSGSVLDYRTITSIVASGATAGNVTAGTSATASSAWVRLDEWADAPLGGQVSTFGVATWMLEQTFDDPNSNTNPVPPYLTVWQTIQNGSSASGNPTFGFPTSPIFVRLTQTAGAGSVRGTFVNYNVVNR